MTKTTRLLSRWFRAILTISGISVLLLLSAECGNAASPFVSGELLVQHRAGTTPAQANQVIRGLGATVAGEIPQVRVLRISVPADAMEQVQAALSQNPHISFVELNFFRGLTATPNDTQYPSQWHLPNIQSPSGWDISTGSSAVPIAIIDTGVDPTHPDLGAKLLTGWNFVTGTSDTHDVYGHGTKVAGSAAAISNNGSGVTGVAWANPVMPLAVSGATGSATDASIASAITYAADHGVKVVNISFGGPSSSATLQSAVDYAWSKGVIIFASAGNYGTTTPNYPAACNNVVAVSATTSGDTLASWSSFGNWVDISAPGASILTTANGGGYAYASGTSFSSPISAGLAALVLSLNPALKNSDVEALIKSNANDLGTAGYDPQFGYGKVNVYYTLLAAKNALPQPDTTAPAASISSPTVGATVTGVAAVNVSATDNVGVAKVELYVDGALFATDIISPFSFSWDTAKVANGSHSLMAIAYDAVGNAGQSASVNVTVSNIADTSAPTATISSPTNGATVSGTVSIKASATDNVGVTRMELYIDGALKGTSTTFSLSYSWNIRKASTGAHTVSVKAYDAAGNMGVTSITVFK